MRISHLLFGCETREGTKESFPNFLLSRFPFGKYLILTDEDSALALGQDLKRIPKKVWLVLKREDDLLPLFHLSDGVTCVVGAGGAVDAARYFAAVRGLPFVGVCLSCAPSGLLRGSVFVRVGDTETEYPVPPPAVLFADFDCMAGDERGKADAAAFLAACALSLFSFCACRDLGLPARGENAESVESLFDAAICHALPLCLLPSSSANAGEIFRAVLTAEYCFRSGFPTGEVFRFADIAAKRLEKREDGVSFSPSCRSAAFSFDKVSCGDISSPKFSSVKLPSSLYSSSALSSSPHSSALLSLSAPLSAPLSPVPSPLNLLLPCVVSLAKLYALFFESGFYRGGKVDYNSRFQAADSLAAKAGIKLRQISVPSVAELEKYAHTFSEKQNALFAKISVLLAEIEVFEADFGHFYPEIERETLLQILFLLPELSLMPYGIEALMRDFSLL